MELHRMELLQGLHSWQMCFADAPLGDILFPLLDLGGEQRLEEALDAAAARAPLVGIDRILVSPAALARPAAFAMPGVFGPQEPGLRVLKEVNPHCARRF